MSDLDSFHFPVTDPDLSLRPGELIITVAPGTVPLGFNLGRGRWWERVSGDTYVLRSNDYLQMRLFDEDEIEPTRLNRLSLRQRKVSKNLNSIRSDKPAKESKSVSRSVKSLPLGSFMTATANILPKEMSEAVKGDLIEIREEMKDEGHGNGWINFTSFGKLVLVIFAALKIKLSDFVHSKKSGTNNS